VRAGSTRQHEAAEDSLNHARAEFRLARALLAKDVTRWRSGAGRCGHDRRTRKRGREAQEKADQTAARIARDYHKDVAPIRTTKHGRQWLNSIEARPIEDRTPEQQRQRKLLDTLLDRPIDSIEPLCLLDSLVPLCRAVPETGFRVYQRLALVFDAAILAKQCTSNPALPIRKELARRVGRRERGEFAAMDWRRLPAFIERLRQAEGTAARSLELLILTAARTSEALGCEWQEIDTERREWRVPAGRMKLREEHETAVAEAGATCADAGRISSPLGAHRGHGRHPARGAL
jgi:integrase